MMFSTHASHMMNIRLFITIVIILINDAAVFYNNDAIDILIERLDVTVQFA